MLVSCCIILYLESIEHYLKLEEWHLMCTMRLTFVYEIMLT